MTTTELIKWCWSAMTEHEKSWNGNTYELTKTQCLHTTRPAGATGADFKLAELLVYEAHNELNEVAFELGLWS